VNRSWRDSKCCIMITYNIFAKILPKFLPINRAVGNFSMKARYQTPLIPKRYYAGEESYIYHNLTLMQKIHFSVCDVIQLMSECL
jgi:hypothetical protein